ncbi:hypothetical protein DXG01_004584 [Tephrocybe rancida]|nr:hypothetical protein DXG01_004584 [Tephrocybe rancida]
MTPRTPSPNTFDAVRAFVKRLRAQEGQPVKLILHYNPNKTDLRPWLWPIDIHGIRIKPEDLDDHRNSHDFRAPACFCGVLDGKPTAYIESLFAVKEGSAEAICARGRCGYSGLPVRFRNPSTGEVTTFGLLMQLDDTGLPEDLFITMFSRCARCQWVMTNEVFPRHTCMVQVAPASGVKSKAIKDESNRLVGSGWEAEAESDGASESETS